MRWWIWLVIMMVTIFILWGGGVLLGWWPGDHIDEFIQWASARPAVGSVIVGLCALMAAGVAYRGVLQTALAADGRTTKEILALDDRARKDRHIVDKREREADRHDRFFKITEKLSSNLPMERMGALISISVLADEWEKDSEINPTQHDSSEPVAENTPSPKDARGNTVLNSGINLRDACVEIICAYLRSFPAGTHTSNSAEQAHEWAESPWLMPDRDARMAAIWIIREHAKSNSKFVWPSIRFRLYGAHLERAKLSGTHLEGARLGGAYLVRTALRKTHLEGARLYQAHMEGAYLQGAYLQRANMREAHLERAHLQGAHLEGADLRGAYLGSWESDDMVQLYGKVKDESGRWVYVQATWDDKTKWPTDFPRDEVIRLQKESAQ